MNNTDKIIEILQRRIDFFKSKAPYQDYEAKELKIALDTIKRLVPPEYFNSLYQSEVSADLKYAREKAIEEVIEKLDLIYSRELNELRTFPMTKKGLADHARAEQHYKEKKLEVLEQLLSDTEDNKSDTQCRDAEEWLLKNDINPKFKLHRQGDDGIFRGLTLLDVFTQFAEHCSSSQHKPVSEDIFCNVCGCLKQTNRNMTAPLCVCPQHKPQIPSEEEIDAAEYLIKGGYFTEAEIKHNKPYNPDPAEVINLMNGFAKWALSQTKK